MPSSLTGAWSGAFRYPGDALPETVFEAWIEETGGVFTGGTREPNLLGLGVESVVTADIDGVREGRRVRFTKFTDGSGDMRHAILYEGDVDADFSRIDGTWTIPGDWSGRFFMTRSDDGEAIAAELSTEAE